MRLIERSGHGQLDLQFLWLPTWIGINSALKEEIERHMNPLFVGKDLTEDTLNEAHDALVDFLQKKFPNLPGLSDYLDALKFVRSS
jgi:hypothetical protein